MRHRSPEHMAAVRSARTEDWLAKLSRAKRKPPRTASRLIRDIMLAFDASDMTYGQAAKRLNVDIETICNWRHGKSEMKLLDAEAFAEILGYRLTLTPMSDLTSIPD
jgi:hypothetical protein